MPQSAKPSKGVITERLGGLALPGTGPRRPQGLSQWQETFKDIYGLQNINLKPADIWLRLMEEAGEVAADFRREDHAALLRDLPDVFAWLCAHATHHDFKLEDVVWNKFPGVCPYCLLPKNCTCIADPEPEINESKLSSHRTGRRPATLDDWAAMFGKIYGNVNKIQSSKAVGFHFMEEVSEVARELRREDIERHKVELADVFAWLVAVFQVAQARHPTPSRSLSDCIWAVYPAKCDRCRHNPCRPEKHKS